MILSTDTYKIFSDFYDSYVGKFNEDFDFYKTFCNKSDSIIEIGCGTGRILDYFLNQDYKIIGVDVSEEMLNKAKNKLDKWIIKGHLELYNYDFTNGGFKDSFDKALITFYTFNYIIDKPQDFLSNVYDSLNSNGLLLMDLFYPTVMYDKSIDNVWIKKDYNINGLNISIEDNRRVVDNIERRQQIFKLNGKEIGINTDRKYYNPADIKGFLTKVGFKDIQLSLDYDIYGFKDELNEQQLKKNFIVKAKK